MHIQNILSVIVKKIKNIMVVFKKQFVPLHHNYLIDFKTIAYGIKRKNGAERHQQTF